MVPSRTLSDARILLQLLKENCGVRLKTLENSKFGAGKSKTNLRGRIGDGSGAGSGVSDGVMRVRLEPDLVTVVVSHLLADCGVHSRIPAASFPFSFLPAAPPHGPDAQECVGGVKRADRWPIRLKSIV